MAGCTVDARKDSVLLPTGVEEELCSVPFQKVNVSPADWLRGFAVL